MDKRDGDIFILWGCFLTLTIVGAILGVPLLILGALIVTFAPEPDDGESK